MRRAAGIKRAGPGKKKKKPDGEVNALKMSNRARVRAVVFLAALFAVLAGLAVQGRLQAAESSRNLQYTYDRAMGDLNDCVSSMQTTLEKSLYANTATQQNSLAARILREASMAKSSLSVLPVSDGALFEASRFITQAGDFAMSLSRRISAGQELTEEEHETLRQLGEYAAKLSETLSAADPDFSAPSSSEWKDTEDLFTDYPTLIYDGPFSDSTEKAEPRGLPAGEADAAAALGAAVSYVGGTLQVTGETAGRIPCYEIAGTDADGRSVELAVTKQGAQVLWMMAASEGGAAGVPDDAEGARMRDAARAYLDARGYDGMEATYAQFYAGVAVYNFASVQGGVILYPDLVKVYVERQSGKIVGVDAYNYLFSHAVRELPIPVLTEQEARERVSDALAIVSARLALIPKTAVVETLCYEFKGTYGDAEFIVYINAVTGEEEEIFEILNSDEGQLVV